MGRLPGSATLGAAVLAAGAAVVLAAAPASGAGAHPRPPEPGARAATAGPGADQQRPVLLINGARLMPGPGSGTAGGLAAGTASGMNAMLLTRSAGGTTYVVPADALPYLGRGLSPGLFDVRSLRRAEAGGRLPVQVRYAGQVPSLPGVTITAASGGSARGYLSAASARAFGTALARQYAADHSRASYGQDGLFAGQVSVSLPGAAAPRRPPGRPVRHFPMQTLTVTATNLAGQPDTGDQVEILNADNSGLFADPVESSNVFYHGVAKFSVPAGDYWAVGFFSPAAGAPQVRMPVLPQFSVRGATTVRMPESAADSRIQMVTPRPAQVDYTNFLMVRFGRSGPPGIMGLDVPSPSVQVWVSPTTTRPTVGGLQALTAAQLDSPPAAAASPYEYGLAYLATSGLIPPQRHVVHTAALATVAARYYQAAPSRVQQFMTVGTSLLDKLTGYAGSGVIFRAPSQITEYLSASHSLIWTDQYFQQASLFSEGGGQFENGRTYVPGERVTENWGAFPLHVAPNVNLVGGQNPDPFLDVGAARAGDTLGFYLTPFSGNQPGYTGSGYLGIPGVKFSGQFSIDVNGKQVASGNAARPVKILGEFGTTVTVSPRPSVIRLALTAQRTGPGYPLSSASSTVWTWHSAHEAGGTVPPGWWCPTGFLSRSCSVQPLMALRYAIPGLALDGTAPAGQQVLQVFAGHLPLATSSQVTGVKVAVSLDGGTTWHPAQVSGGAGRYTAVYPAPAGTMVSLRTSAADAAGGTVTDTLINAYRIAS